MAERRKVIVEELHDRQAVAAGRFKAVGDFTVVWINKFEITEELQDDEWVFIKKKLLKFWRVEVPVGDTIMGFPVVQVDPEWVKREREILENWKGPAS